MRLVWALLLAAAGLAWAAQSSVVMLNLPAPTLAVGAPSPAVGPPRRVLVMVIDGLGADAAAALPLEALGSPRASVDLRAEPPTFSSAQYVAFLTGVGPVDSGVRTNQDPRRTPLDSVVAAVRARGGRAVEVGDAVDWWGRLFAWDEALRVAPERLMAEAQRQIADARNDLVLVHVAGVDRAGHQSGAASDSYRRAAIAAGEQVTALAAVWRGRGPMLVLSDHGHMPRGGHGGSEPEVRRAFLVLAGPGVRAGASGEASTADVGPTLAALLGVPAPAQALGRTLFEALDLDPGARGVLDQAEARRLAVAGAEAERGRQALAATEQRQRLVRGLIVLAFTLASAWGLRRLGAGAGSGLLHGAGTTALLAGFVALAAERLTFSAFRSLKIEAAVVGLLALGAGLAVLARPLRATINGKCSLTRARAMAAGVALGASPPALAAFVAAGLRAPRFSCRPDWLAAGPTLGYLAPGPILICAAALVVAARRAER